MPDWHPLHQAEQRTEACSEPQEGAVFVSSFCCKSPLIFSNPGPFQGLRWLRGLLNPKQACRRLRSQVFLGHSKLFLFSTQTE